MPLTEMLPRSIMFPVDDERGNTMETLLLTEQEAAKILAVSPRTLATWRSVGRYRLRFVKVGRSVRYRLEDIEDFIERRSREVA